MKQNRTAIVFILLGLLAAVAAAAVVFFLTSTVRAPSGPTASTTPQATVTTRDVIIATTDIPANSVISSTQVVTAAYPIDLIPGDAITNIGDVISTTARMNILSRQILQRGQFIAAGGGTGASVNIAAGKVLVAFPATDMLNSTGAVQAKDKVDILLSIPISGTTRLDAGSAVSAQVEPGTTTLVTQGTLQNIEVYSVGFWSPPGQQAQTSAQQQQAANSLKVITFIVDHQEALILKFVKDSGGTIDLAVRSAQDTNTIETDPVTIDYLVDLFGFIGLNQPGP